MNDGALELTAVEGRYSLNGASYVLSVKLDRQSIRSAIIYDDELAVTFTDPLGHLQSLMMPLVRTYDDVGTIELRGQDDSSDTGWRYVPFEFARGVPDLTPVKVKGSTGDDVLYGGLGADVVKGGKGLKVTVDEANSIKVNFDTALSVETWDSLVDGAGGLNELVFVEVA
ncbi:hypothetical protein HIMB100_00007740 [SAR116 cluster alpha proteobacterium HIMB100]|nr:hypothetical protein HIMB100_00007740 [SAR116 cluster alpha proteobacterium HIMB100]